MSFDKLRTNGTWFGWFERRRFGRIVEHTMCVMSGEKKMRLLRSIIWFL